MLAGVTALLGAVSHPLNAPTACLLIAVVAVLLRGPARRALAVAVGATSALLVTIAVWGFGLPAIPETLDVTRAYQAARPPLSELLDVLGRGIPRAPPPRTGR